VSVAVRSAEKAEDLLEQSRKSVEAAERLTEAKMCIKAIAVELAPRDAAERLREAAEEGDVPDPRQGLRASARGAGLKRAKLLN